MTADETSDANQTGESAKRAALQEGMRARDRIPTALTRFGLIHIVLMLVYFLPGGLIWNRIDVTVLGLPLGVFMWWILLPILIFLNAVFYVRSFWREDQQVSAEVSGVET